MKIPQIKIWKTKFSISIGLISSIFLIGCKSSFHDLVKSGIAIKQIRWLLIATFVLLGGATGLVTVMADGTPQTITFTSTAPGHMDINDNYTPTATATSGLSVTFTIDSSSSAICSISAGLVTANEIGTCTIDANQSGNGTYSAASQVQQNISVYPTYSSVILSNDPQDYWPLSDTGGSSATNLSGNNNTGALQGGVTEGVTPGITPGAMDPVMNFNGSTGYISTTKSYNNPTTYSIVAWFKTTATNGDYIAQFANVQTGYSGYADRQLWVGTNGELYYGGYNGSSLQILSSSTTVNNGQWQFVVGVQSSSGMTLYLNGVPLGSNSSYEADNFTGYWRFGDNSVDSQTYWENSGTGYFNGDLTDIAVFSTALTATQITNMYEATTLNQILTFTSAAPTAAIFGGSYTPSATSNSGLPVTLTIDSSTSADCSMSAGIVSFTSGGLCTIDANQAGNSSYQAAPQVQQTFDILQLSASNIAPAGGATVTFTVSGGISGQQYRLYDNTVTPVGTSSQPSSCAVGSGASSCTTNSLNDPANSLNWYFDVIGDGVTSNILEVTWSPPILSVNSTSQTGGATATFTITGALTGATYKLFQNTTTPVGQSTTDTSCVIPTGTTTCTMTFGDSAHSLSWYFDVAGDGITSNVIEVTWTAPVVAASTTVPTSGVSVVFTITNAISGQKYSLDDSTTPTIPINNISSCTPASGTTSCTITQSQPSGSLTWYFEVDDTTNSGIISNAVEIIWPAAQTITFTGAAPIDLIVGNTYTPVATATSGYTVSFTIDTSTNSICSIAAGIVTLNSSGTCTIDANQAGGVNESDTTNYLPAAQVQQFVTDVPYQQNVLNISPLGFWPLSDSGTTTASDISNGDNNGNLQGGVAEGQTGFSNTDNTPAMNFNGTSGYISTATKYTNPTTYTIAGWFNTTASNGGIIVQFGQDQTGSGGNYDRQLYVGTNGELYFGECCNATTLATSAAVNNGQWNYAVGVSTGSGMALYLNGVLVASNNYSENQNMTGYWRIGGGGLKSSGWPNDGSSWFNGDIADVAVFASALTANQVSALYNNELGQTISFASTAPTNATVNSTYTPSATASSSLPVSITADPTTSSICSIASGIVTFNAPGTCLLDANQAGNSTYVAATQVQQSITTNSVAQTALSLSPNDFWALDERSGNVATNLANINNFGTLEGGITEGVTPGVNPENTAPAMAFNGSSGNIITSAPFTAASLTIAAWFKTSTTGVIVSSTNNNLALMVGSSGRVSFELYSSSANYATSATAYDNGVWHFAIGVVSSSGMQLYVDGVEVGSNTLTSWSSGGDLQIGWSGANAITGNRYFSGDIADVALFSYALNSTQLNELYSDNILTILAPPLPNGVIGQAYSISLAAISGTMPYNWSLASGTLPAGLNLNSSTGTISGTPTAIGTANFTVDITDSSSPQESNETTFSIVITNPLIISTTTLPNATTGVNYSQTLTATGGTIPYTWDLESGALPAGLSLNTATGVISGMPTTIQTQSFTIQATDSSFPQLITNGNLAITVAAPPLLVFSSSNLPPPIPWYSYSATLIAAGGSPGYTWSVSSGSLPSGLSLASSTGVISGTPTTDGTYTFAISVHDSNHTEQTTSKTFSLVVDTLLGWEVDASGSGYASYLSSVSCVNNDFCMAAGANSAGSGSTVIEQWNGSNWNTDTSPNEGSGTELNGVDCLNTSFCMAVGYYVCNATCGTSGNINQTLAEEWNGTSWNIIPSAELSYDTADNGQDLSSISCTSTTFCAAVGGYQNGGGFQYDMAEVWNGSSWSIVTTTNVWKFYFYGISCASSSFCMAVGQGGSQPGSLTGNGPLIEEWNGSAFSQITASTDGAYSNILNGVSCTSIDFCMAVGNGNGAPYAEQWNGTNWAGDEMAYTPSNESSGFSSVYCLSDINCITAGSINGTLTGEWNGVNWYITSSMGMPGSGGQFGGVSCVSSTLCFAVGAYNNRGWKTLIDQFNGSLLGQQAMNSLSAWLNETQVGDAANSAPDGCTCATKDPVNMESGNLNETTNDFDIPGRGFNLEVTRSYNSLNADVNGPFGYGWSSNLDMNLVENEGATQIIITDETGAPVTFTYTDGSWTAPSFNASTLTDDSGTWTYTRWDGDSFTFNSSGQLISETDRNGNETTFTYSGGKLATMTDPSGRTLTFAWSGSNITQITGTGGQTISYTYTNDDLTAVENVAGNYTHYTYSATNDLLTMTEPDGYVVTNTYNSYNQVLTQTDGLGNETTFLYLIPQADETETLETDPNGDTTMYLFYDGFLATKTAGYSTSLAATTSYEYDPSTLGLVSETNPDGNTTTYTYDSNGNMLTETDALNNTTTYTYNSFNEPLTETNAAGVTTTNTYDIDGNLLTTSTPLLNSGGDTLATQTTTYTYGDSSNPGLPTQVEDPNGNITTLTYDQYGNLVSSANALGDETTYTYSILGEKLTMVSPDGNVSGGDPSAFTTSYTYNSLGDLLTTTDPDGNTTTNTYDNDGNLLTTTDADGNETLTSYNADNEAIEVQSKNSSGTVLRTTYTTYDGDGNALTTVDGNGNTTTYSYNVLNQKISSTNALSKETIYAYDGDGNMLTETEPNGDTITDSYNADDKLVGTAYNDGTPNISYTYNDLGEKIGMTDETGVSSWTYNSLGDETSYTNGIGETVSYGYDLDGNETSISYPGEGTVTQRFNAANEETSLTDWNENTSTFTYDANGNLTTEDMANGVNNNYTYDSANNLLAISDTDGNTTVFSANYGRNNDDLLTQDDSQPDSTDEYQYTGLNQVCYAGSTTSDSCGSAPSGADVYSYDGAGNLTNNDGTTQSYNLGDELCWTVSGTNGNNCGTTPSGATIYTYDQNGNLTGITPTSGNATSMSYNAVNQMASLEVGAGAVADYYYDGDGLRQSEITGSNTINFTWNDSGSLPLLLQQTAGSDTTNYIYGPQGLPLEEILPDASTYYYSQDNLGSTRTLTDASGTVQNTYDYDSYGNIISSTGDISNNLLYDGAYMDPSNSFYYLINRYYDPSLGQFLTVDPLVEETGMPYAYTAGDPLNEIDPSGDLAVDSADTGGLTGITTSCFSSENSGEWLSTIPGFTSLPGIDKVGGAMQANASAYIRSGGKGVYLRGVASDADVLADIGLKATVVGGVVSFAANVAGGENPEEAGVSAAAGTYTGYVLGGVAGGLCESTFGIATFGIGTILCAGAGIAVGGGVSLLAQDVTSWAWSNI